MSNATKLPSDRFPIREKFPYESFISGIYDELDKSKPDALGIWETCQWIMSDRPVLRNGRLMTHLNRIMREMEDERMLDGFNLPQEFGPFKRLTRNTELYKGIVFIGDRYEPPNERNNNWHILRRNGGKDYRIFIKNKKPEKDDLIHLNKVANNFAFGWVLPEDYPRLPIYTFQLREFNFEVRDALKLIYGNEGCMSSDIVREIEPRYRELVRRTRRAIRIGDELYGPVRNPEWDFFNERKQALILKNAMGHKLNKYR